MKRIFYFAAILLVFMSCSKDEEETKTTYEIINNSEYFDSSCEYLDGTLWEVVVFQYIGDDIAKQENIDPIEYGGGTSGKLVIGDNIEKIQVSFKMLPKESPYYGLPFNNRKYVVAYKFMEKGKNNVVTIDGSTLVSNSPKSASIESKIILKEAMKSYAQKEE